MTSRPHLSTLTSSKGALWIGAVEVASLGLPSVPPAVLLGDLPIGATIETLRFVEE